MGPDPAARRPDRNQRVKEDAMLLNDPMFYLVAGCSLAVLFVLMLGLGSFARGGDFNRRNANRFMRWRIYAQAIAVALIVGFAYIRYIWGN